MTADILAGIAGAILAFAFAYAPKLREWYAAQDGDRKRQVMGVAVVGAAGLVAGLSCVPQVATVAPAGWLIKCDQSSLGELVRLTFYALAGNQTTYLLAVRPPKAKA